MYYTLYDFQSNLLPATEGFDGIKTKINALVQKFKEFFKFLIKKVKEWFRIHIKHDVYAPKGMMKYIREEYSEDIKNYRDEVNKLKDALIKTKNEIDDALANRKDVDVSGLKANVYSNTIYIDANRFHSHIDIYLKHSSSNDRIIEEIKQTKKEMKDKSMSKEDRRKAAMYYNEMLNQSFELISNKDLDKIMNQLSEYEKIGIEFDKFMKKLNIDSKYIDVLPYYNKVLSHSMRLSKYIIEGFTSSIYDPTAKD